MKRSPLISQPFSAPSRLRVSPTSQWKLDALTAEAERAIELLQERRTALISAAVTGKIDVREFSRGVAGNAETACQ